MPFEFHLDKLLFETHNTSDLYSLEVWTDVNQSLEIYRQFDKEHINIFRRIKKNKPTNYLTKQAFVIIF